MKYLFKFLFFLLITGGIAYGLYHTSFGKQFIDTRIQELQTQWTNTGEQTVETGTIIDPGIYKDPLQVQATPSTLGKRLEYYRANKTQLGVQE